MKFSNPVRVVLDRKGWGALTVSPDDTVYKALESLAERDIGALAVVEDGHLAGMFSERDYARKIVLLGRSSAATKVREVMSPPDWITPDESVDQCLHAMTDRRVRHLAVMNGPELVGIVSIGDLVNWIITEQAETIGYLTDFIAGAYPG